MVNTLKSLTLYKIIPTTTYYFWHRCLYTRNTLFYGIGLLKNFRRGTGDYEI